MQCEDYGSHEFPEEDLPSDSFDYMGKFKVISSAGEAVLVKKLYRAQCPKCKSRGLSDSYKIEKWKLELVPVDNLDFGEV